jgi:hypothetical protein
MTAKPEFEKNTVAFSTEPGSLPPWTDAQRDAQIEALRFAYCELVSALNESGRLDAQQVLEGLAGSDWLYAGKKPDTHAAVRWLVDTIDYMRVKIPGPHQAAKSKAARPPAEKKRR